MQKEGLLWRKWDRGAPWGPFGRCFDMNGGSYREHDALLHCGGPTTSLLLAWGGGGGGTYIHVRLDLDGIRRLPILVPGHGDGQFTLRPDYFHF